jgi:hypothetical protein
MVKYSREKKKADRDPKKERFLDCAGRPFARAKGAEKIGLLRSE